LITLATRVGRPPANHESHKRSTNAVANDLDHIGRTLYLRNGEAEMANAAEYFQAAIKADTNFVLAEAALSAAWSWAWVGTNAAWALLPQAKEIAERALAKDDTLSEAHLALALHAWIKEWNWPKAQRHYQKAIKYDPQNPQPHEWYGMFLRSMGRTNDAIRELETALELNPRSQTGVRFLGVVMFSARRYAEAIGRSEMAVEIEPRALNVTILSQALLWDGQVERSLAASARAAELEGEDAAKIAGRTAELARTFREEGAEAFWRQRLQFIREKTSDPVQLAGACACAGQTDEALGLLERAEGERHVYLTWDLKTHPQWDSLRGEPRFKRLLVRLRLD